MNKDICTSGKSIIIFKIQLQLSMQLCTDNISLVKNENRMQLKNAKILREKNTYLIRNVQQCNYWYGIFNHLCLKEITKEKVILMIHLFYAFQYIDI